MVGGYLGSRRVMPAIGEPGHRLRGAGIGTARVGGGGGGVGGRCVCAGEGGA